MPMMPLSGVRISWLMVARKRDLASFAASARSRAAAASLSRQTSSRKRFVLGGGCRPLFPDPRPRASERRRQSDAKERSSRRLQFRARAPRKLPLHPIKVPACQSALGGNSVRRRLRFSFEPPGASGSVGSIGSRAVQAAAAARSGAPR